MKLDRKFINNIMVMQVVFTKHKNRTYSVEVNRGDSVKLQFQGVGKKFLIPHDLSHFIVESKLDMGQGFWGCVANGALFPGINIIEGRQKAHAKSKSKQVIKEAHQQLRLAECFVRVFYEISTVELEQEQVLVQAKNHLSQISAEIEANKLLDSTILDVYSTLRTFQINWQKIDAEESIKLCWNQKSPSKSLTCFQKS